MPIVAKRIADDTGEIIVPTKPRVRKRPSSPPQSREIARTEEGVEQSNLPAPNPDGSVAASGAARRDDREKKTPKGDYAVGYARPPVEHRFKGKPGPGRPKGSRSHDSILREQAELKRRVRVEGVEKELTQRELAARLLYKQALEDKKEKALFYVLGENARLYPDVTAGSPGQAVTPLSASDVQLLETFFAAHGLPQVVVGRPDVALADVLEAPPAIFAEEEEDEDEDEDEDEEEIADDDVTHENGDECA